MSTVSSQSPLPSVAEALAIPEMRAGEPELLTAAEHLDRSIRWAHVVAGAEAVPLLDGAELVLTTGVGWPRDAPALARISRALVAADPAAIVFELGRSFDAVPRPLVEACERAGIPLAALHREVRFVQITQRIHQRILAAQTEALAARAEVHAMLTELGLNRSPVDYVVAQLAETLGAPVVLEDSAHRVVAWAPGGDGDAHRHGEALSEWERAGGHAFPLPSGWERVPVEAQGRRWGSLTALPGPPHAAGRLTVLELGAFALALGRLADPDGEQWLRLSSKRMFDAILTGRYRRDAELATQLAAGGLPISDRRVLGATLRGVGSFGAHSSLERAVLETAFRRAIAPEGRVILAPDPDDGGHRVLLALVSFPLDDPRVDPAVSPPPLAARIARELELLVPETSPPSWQAHLALGPAGRGIRALITSLEQARASGVLDAAVSIGRVSVQQAERQPLAYLVRGLAATPEVQDFAEAALGPLAAHDTAEGAGHSGDLIRVLSAYLEHPTNRSLAAQRAQLSRSVFYQRLALIESLLGVDLSDGHTIATLTVALLARR